MTTSASGTGDWRSREQHLRQVSESARRMPREPVSPAIRWAVYALGACWLAALVWQAVVLPDPTPIHWGTDGVPDGWASKPASLLVQALEPAIGLAVLPLSRLALSSPDMLSLPGADLGWWTATPQRMLRLERLLREDLWLLLGWLLALLTGLGVMTARAARLPGGVDDSTTPELVGVAGMVLLLLGYVAWSALNRYAPPADLA